ncbi:MAG: SLBB domain-containing protein, partial [Candidatus Tectomicrobia bacterium]
SNNLTLQPRDTVRVFAHDDFVDPHLVRISGLVHRPGVHPLTAGMRVRDLVLRAGNIHKFAYLDSAELTRQIPEAEKGVVTRVEINLRQALAGNLEHNLLLQDFDHLLVRQMPGVKLQPEVPPLGGLVARQMPGVESQSEAQPPVRFFPLQEDDEQALAIMRRASIVQERAVEISGEVRFPGVYPVQTGERLSSVLQRAGGFTEQAYLRGAVFNRLSVQEAQQKRLDELLIEEEQALLAESATEVAVALTPEEVQGRQQELAARRTLLERLRTVEPEGRIVVRLQPLDVFTGSDQDIGLEAGDRLDIPQTPEHVNILGQVYNRTSLIYDPDKDIGHYLERVGGIKPDANEKEIYLVQVDGTVISNTQDQFIMTQVDGQTTYLGDFFDVRPQPGDTIVVPRRIKTPATLRLTRDIVQIIFQSATTIGILAALL